MAFNFLTLTLKTLQLSILGKKFVLEFPQPNITIKYESRIKTFSSQSLQISLKKFHLQAPFLWKIMNDSIKIRESTKKDENMGYSKKGALSMKDKDH